MSTWIAKKVIRLQTEGGGRRKGSNPSPRGGCAQLQLNINSVYKVCQWMGCYPSPLKPPLMERTLSVNYPVLRQNRRVLLYRS